MSEQAKLPEFLRDAMEKAALSHLKFGGVYDQYPALMGYLSGALMALRHLNTAEEMSAEADKAITVRDMADAYYMQRLEILQAERDAHNENESRQEIAG